MPRPIPAKNRSIDGHRRSITLRKPHNHDRGIGSFAMPFNRDEYFPGMIAYFTVNQLRRDKRIRTTNPTRDTKPRPFVCYAMVDGELYWTALTGTYNRCRRTVDKKWLRSPSGKFHAG